MDEVRLLKWLMLAHAVADWIGGVVLLLWPGFVGVVTPDDFVWSHYGVRIFGAALLAIGTASYQAYRYQTKLELTRTLLWKSVWSGAVVLGMLLTVASQQQGLPTAILILLVVFLLGFGTWAGFWATFE